LTSLCRTKARCFSSILMRNNVALAEARSASGAGRGDCRRWRRKVSQVGNADLIELEAVTLPLQHAYGFELANVGAAAIKMHRQRRRASRRARRRAGQSMATVSAIEFDPVVSQKDNSFLPSAA
jgi:hypothetical protein